MQPLFYLPRSEIALTSGVKLCPKSDKNTIFAKNQPVFGRKVEVAICSAGQSYIFLVINESRLEYKSQRK
jgi:hypothetical protein